MTWTEEGIELCNGEFQKPAAPLTEKNKIDARRRTMAGQVLMLHHHGEDKDSSLNLRFDALASPDNNYVSILTTLEAVGLEKLDIPWVLSNCHNALCSISGTQNSDDHKFGEDAARRYGAVFLPAYQGVIHQYMRECMAAPMKMILGSDSHTRYGPLGTLGFGEGGGEIAKHILGYSYPLNFMSIVGVELKGSLRKGVGPMDVALSIIRETHATGKLKDTIVEFHGEGISNLSMDMRFGIDVMTTETGALSSIWAVDDVVRDYLIQHERGADYRYFSPQNGAYYDHLLSINLEEIEPMMALPPHPGNVYPVSYVMNHAMKIFSDLDERKVIPGFSFVDKIRNGKVSIGQGVITGCAGGTAENAAAVSDILSGEVQPGDMRMAISTASTPVTAALLEVGVAKELLSRGIPLGMSICGGCFGVSDIPAHGELSARHVTRNFPMREGAKRDQHQASAVMLMDARSIAATFRNGGFLTSAMDVEYEDRKRNFTYDGQIYRRSVKNFFGKAEEKRIIRLGPGISEWPEFPELKKHLILKVALNHPGDITTDDLIPSGEISALRSHPLNLSRYTLVNKDPGYAKRAMEFQRSLEEEARSFGISLEETSLGTIIAAQNIGEGSSREQATSSQRILGGWANLASGYATQRYLRNLMNYGMIPLLSDDPLRFREGEILIFYNIREEIMKGKEKLRAVRLVDGSIQEFGIPSLSEKERELILSGGLINYERKRRLKK